MNANLVKRGIDLLYCVPSHTWISTNEIHELMTNNGYDQSLRTLQRDLASLSVEFGLESRETAGSKQLEWTRTKELV